VVPGRTAGQGCKIRPLLTVNVKLGKRCKAKLTPREFISGSATRVMVRRRSDNRRERTNRNNQFFSETSGFRNRTNHSPADFWVSLLGETSNLVSAGAEWALSSNLTGLKGVDRTTNTSLPRVRCGWRVFESRVSYPSAFPAHPKQNAESFKAVPIYGLDRCGAVLIREDGEFLHPGAASASWGTVSCAPSAGTPPKK
jgi:hypothetical protein